MLAATPIWQRVVILAPVIVIGFGLVAAAFILLGRALAHSVRESQHQRLIYAGFVLLAGAVALLTYLGVKLPKE